MGEKNKDRATWPQEEQCWERGRTQEDAVALGPRGRASQLVPMKQLGLVAKRAVESPLCPPEAERKQSSPRPPTALSPDVRTHSQGRWSLLHPPPRVNP